jgi:hypothetical protein
MKRGQAVEVTEYGGRKLRRTVVLDRGATIVVCDPEEFAAATKDKREPEGIGFPRKNVKEMQLSAV